ncbi:MAG: 2-hydroxyacyl-CoA dehydratase [Deltaproteobacteria bacterium]|nr:2-hydroxyacyl-CoA dehydratase [Deltaproteobacteria bacterium]
MTRKEYLLKQKKQGMHLMGVFPAQYPKEILWAMNVVPAEIWDPPLQTTAASAHLQSYICSVVQSGLELVLQGKTDILDAFLFPHTCDSIQNMASVIFDYIGTQKPCYFFYHPKAPYGASAREFYRQQLRELAENLSSQFGPLDPNVLKEKVEQGQYIARLLEDLYQLRAQNRLDLNNVAFYELIRRGEYLFPDAWAPELEKHVKQQKEAGKESSIPILLSGVLPNPAELLKLLDELGVLVAHDDLLNGSRRLLIPGNDFKDPFEQLTESYFAMPPCSTRGSSVERRRDYLLRLVETTGARGVLFNIVKFCEPEWFDIPNLQESLKERGIPSLVLDTELNQGLSGQLSTRAEAFIETLNKV